MELVHETCDSCLPGGGPYKCPTGQACVWKITAVRAEHQICDAQIHTSSLETKCLLFPIVVLASKAIFTQF